MISTTPRIPIQPIPRPASTADAAPKTAAAHADLRDSGATLPTPTRRLTKQELRLVCSIINRGDVEFRSILLAHVRDDGEIARAVFKGLCRAPNLLKPSAANELLELLRYQGQPKYARNLAVAFLTTRELANSYELMATCAHVLAEVSDTLSASQQKKILKRALVYPAQWQTGDRIRPRLKKLRPWPTEEHSDARLNHVDYAGAVSILLLGRMPFEQKGTERLLKMAVWFARRYPHAENLWLTPLSSHDPHTLKAWQVYVSGQLPTSELAGGLIRASMTATASGCAFSLAKIAMQPPQPPAQAPILFTIGLGATVWTLNVLLGLLRSVGRLTEKYEVPEAQARQVLARK